MKTNRWVRVWLIIGLFMLVIQVMVGGITRLTGSGLSITEWDIVTGSLPPLSEEAWQIEFDKYKETPQYQKINKGMTMGSIVDGGSFKFIYFWEWVHRFWARIMGFVFAIPLLFFVYKKWIPAPLLKRLGVLFLLAALAASFGWIMVASGLVERPWVNAYKLSLHLCIAFIVFAYLWWTYLKVRLPNIKDYNKKESTAFRKLFLIFTTILWIQIFFGGVMSGMKAGAFYATWPDMNGEIIPHIIFNKEQWNVYNFNYYDQNAFVPALIQLIHRSTAYILTFLGLWLFINIFRKARWDGTRKGNLVFITLLISQVFVGILTVINCKGSIPLFYGVLHQFVALMLLTCALYMNYRFKV